MRFVLTLLCAVVVLGLAACSSESPAGADPTTPSVMDERASHTLDPCDLIPREHLEDLGVIDTDTALFQGLTRDHEHIIDCRFDSAETFTFGFHGAPDDQSASDRLATDGSGEARSLDGVGDEAVLIEQQTGGLLLAIDVGDHHLFLRAAATYDLTEDELAGLGSAMVEQLPDAFSFAAIELPEACPDVETPEILDLLGAEVLQARGVSDAGTVLQSCRYLATNGARLAIDVDLLAADVAEVERNLFTSETTFGLGTVTFFVTDDHPGDAVAVAAVTGTDVAFHIDVSAAHGDPVSGITLANLERLIGSMMVLQSDDVAEA